MFIVHVETVNMVRLALLPLATICKRADIKCTIERLSIISVPPEHPFVASLRMLPAFFTCFQFHPDDNNSLEYRSGFLLSLFVTNISNLYSEDLSMTICLRQDEGMAPVKFEDPNTEYVQYSALVLSRPLNIDISPIDFGVFVVIRSPHFINLASDLVILPNEPVYVTVTKTEAKFSALTREVIFTTENNDCVIGGVTEGNLSGLLLTLEELVKLMNECEFLKLDTVDESCICCILFSHKRVALKYAWEFVERQD